MRKNERGITLISLVIYIIGLVVIMGIIGSIISFYNKNMIEMNDTSDVNMELNKFTARMLEETKVLGNEITETGTVITFKNGKKYIYENNKIYENGIIVSQYVTEFLSSVEMDGNKQILKIYIVIEKGEIKASNNLSYVLELQQEQNTIGTSQTIEVQGILRILETTTTLEDPLGNEYVVPGGFGVRTDLATNVEEGIVIEDANGNQFVWVPIGDVKKSDGSTVNIELGRYTFDTTNGSPTLKQSADNFDTEVTVATYFTEKTEFKDAPNYTSNDLEGWVNSAKTYGGYYLSRYSGGGTASLATFTGSTVVLSQRDASLACRNLYDGNEYKKQNFVQCDLANSYAYDTAIVFIQKCSSNSSFANSKSGTACNINYKATGVWSTESGEVPIGYGDWKTNTPIRGVDVNVWDENSYTNVAFRDAWYSDSSSKAGFKGTLTVNTNYSTDGAIQISASTTAWTKGPVDVTVYWPSVASELTKQISIDGGNTWNAYTGTVSVSSNCVIKAKILDSEGTCLKTASLTISNIDTNDPIINAVAETITITPTNNKFSFKISELFTYSSNGGAPLSITAKVDGSSTTTLSAGQHTIECTATKPTGASATASIIVKCTSAVTMIKY